MLLGQKILVALVSKLLPTLLIDGSRQREQTGYWSHAAAKGGKSNNKVKVLMCSKDGTQLALIWWMYCSWCRTVSVTFNPEPISCLNWWTIVNKWWGCICLVYNIAIIFVGNKRLEIPSGISLGPAAVTKTGQTEAVSKTSDSERRVAFANKIDMRLGRSRGEGG